MKLLSKNLKLSTGNNTAIINYIDARSLGISQGDRVELSFKRKKSTAIIDITNDSTLVKRGQIGISKEVTSKIKSKNNSEYLIKVLGKPMSLESIKKKIHGNRLSETDMVLIINDVVNDNLTDIEKTFFVSACYNHELSFDETVFMTNAMVNSGSTLKFKGLVADKHCIGGVAGNRTTCFVTPIIAAAGYTMPKTSSRSITSPAGTADTMEVLCNVTLSSKQIKQVISDVGACMVWGGGMNFVPADPKLIKIEHSVSLTPTGQMIASVLSKKKAAGSTHCLIDIPTGRGSKVESRIYARYLKKRFEKVGRAIGLNVKVVFSDGTEPIGNGIGPALEARDLLWTLSNHTLASKQLKSKGIKLAGDLLKLLGEKHPYQRAKDLVEDGSALKKFNEILSAQGLIEKLPSNISIGKYSFDVVSPISGKIIHIDNKEISEIAKVAGAPFDKGAGVYLNFHKGRKIGSGDILYKIYSNSKDKLNLAIELSETNSSYYIR